MSSARTPQAFTAPELAALWRPVLHRWRFVSVRWTVPHRPGQTGSTQLEATVESALGRGFVLRTASGYRAYYTYVDLAIGAIIPRDDALRRALRRAETDRAASRLPPLSAVLTALHTGAQ